MTYSLLVGGYRDDLSVLTFDPSTAKIKVVNDTKAPPKASWLEPAPGDVGPLASSRTVYSISEVEKGLALSLKLSNDKLEVTSERETLGGPAHIHIMKDGSGLIAANYIGGSIIFFPFNEGGTLSSTSQSTKLDLPYVYSDSSPPNAERQDTAHAHQVLEGEGGQLYVPDLGSDRVWVVERQGESGLDIKGWLQCPPGTGPRHAVFSDDGIHLFVLTELTSEILVFSLANPTYPIIPIPDFKVSIIPNTVPKAGYKYMNAAEIIRNPFLSPTTLYASNRLELQLKDNSEGAVAPEPPTGDTVAIVLLSDAGDKFEGLHQVRTGANAIRGMRISPDGKYVALAGQDGGGLEIWAISGKRGEVWKLAAKDEKIEGVTDLLWL